MEYFHLPPEYQSKHDICLILVSQLEEFLIDSKFAGLRVQKVDISSSLQNNEHVFDYLIRNGLTDEHNKIIKCQLINGLLIDMCNFLCEAFDASTKKRLTVTFALLRKPFLYSLIIILRMLFEEDFIDKFNSESKFDPAHVTEEEKKELIDLSMKVLITKTFTTDDIYNGIFNKEMNSLLNMSDKALHLSTTRNKNNLTGIQNFNYIFSNNDNLTSQWDYIYAKFPAYLLYLVEVMDVIVFSTLNLDSELYNTRLASRIEQLNSILKG